MADSLDISRASCLDGVAHGFLGRRGGVSKGVAAGLNAGLGSLDDPSDVAANRRLAADAVLPGAQLVGVHQVHSARCVTVTEPWADDGRPEADALVTDRPGLLLGIVTADCAPVLLADAAAGVVGATHAGWKGALHGVCESVVAMMAELGADRARIVAALGPCIAQQSYEVDGAFRDRFLAAGDNAQFFVRGRAGHWQFDLEGYVASRLAGSGVRHVERLGLDTYAAPHRFYSFRRATHCHEPTYGRQISIIGLPRNQPGQRPE